MSIKSIRDKIKSYLSYEARVKVVKTPKTLEEISNELMKPGEISNNHNKFEYLHFNRQLSLRQLNAIGDSGWELVSHTGVANGSNFGQYYVFKREKK